MNRQRLALLVALVAAGPVVALLPLSWAVAIMLPLCVLIYAVASEGI